MLQPVYGLHINLISDCTEYSITRSITRISKFYPEGAWIMPSRYCRNILLLLKWITKFCFTCKALYCVCRTSAFSMNLSCSLKIIIGYVIAHNFKVHCESEKKNKIVEQIVIYVQKHKQCNTVCSFACICKKLQIHLLFRRTTSIPNMLYIFQNHGRNRDRTRGKPLNQQKIRKRDNMRRGDIHIGVEADALGLGVNDWDGPFNAEQQWGFRWVQRVSYLSLSLSRTHARTHTRAGSRIYKCTRACTYTTHTCGLTHTWMHARTHVHTHTHRRARGGSHIHAREHARSHTHKRARSGSHPHTHIHKHTHTHVNTWRGRKGTKTQRIKILSKKNLYHGFHINRNRNADRWISRKQDVVKRSSD